MGFGGPRTLSFVGDFKHEFGSDTSVPGSFTPVLIVAIPANKKRELITAEIFSEFECEWELKDGATLLGFGSTDPGRSKDVKFWQPTRFVSAGGSPKNITLSIKQRDSSPAVTVKAELQSSETDD